jgi:hypothetical protein
LLADPRNNSPNDRIAILITRSIGSSATCLATRKTIPITTVMTTVKAMERIRLVVRSGRLRKNATYAVNAASGVW